MNDIEKYIKMIIIPALGQTLYMTVLAVLISVVVFQNGELEQWSDYVADDLIQHSHEIGQGSTAYKNYVAEHGVTFDFVFQLLGQGNYVVSYGQTQIDGVAYAQYDIFRLENGLIVEHWDNKEVMPKVEDLTNRGKF